MEKININELGKVLNLGYEDRVLQSFESEIACLKLAEKINEIIDFLQTKGE